MFCFELILIKTQWRFLTWSLHLYKWAKTIDLCLGSFWEVPGPSGVPIRKMSMYVKCLGLSCRSLIGFSVEENSWPFKVNLKEWEKINCNHFWVWWLQQQFSLLCCLKMILMSSVISDHLFNLICFISKVKQLWVLFEVYCIYGMLSIIF